ncbi:MAG: hypothetical protein P3A28_08270 [Gemmatimonadota bacterium]|nr:hypothetical protein [Gemmatimonadota bacterium]
MIQRALINAVSAAALSGLIATSLEAQGVRVKLPAWSELVLMDSLRQEHKLDAAPEVIYQAVLKTYTDLGIPTGNTDGKSGIIGSERFERMRALGKAPMSLSFSCGESATGPNADAFRLTIAVVTWVKPTDGGGTTLGIAAAAAGVDVTGVYKNPRECSSTGRIETKILEGVKKLAR